MATIDDYGDTSEPLNNPPLGGPSGWAKAVRDAITDKVSKTGDTMTGNLVINTESDSAASATVTTRTAAGKNGGFEGRQGGNLAYIIRFPDTVGRFRLYAYDANGANPKTALLSTGVGTGLLEVFGSPSTTNGIATKGYVDTAAVAAYNAGRADAGLPALADAEARTRLGIEESE